MAIKDSAVKIRFLIIFFVLLIHTVVDPHISVKIGWMSSQRMLFKHKKVSKMLITFLFFFQVQNKIDA